jgi:starch synthase
VTIKLYRRSKEDAAGFLFNKFSRDGLASAIGRAFEAHASKRDLRRMRRVAMSRKFDWKRSAADYLRLYRGVAVA